PRGYHLQRRPPWGRGTSHPHRAVACTVGSGKSSRKMKHAHPNLERRKLLAYGAGLMLFSWAWHRASAEDEVQIQLAGTPNGSHVWCRPSGLLIEPGQAVRWINR